MAMAAAMAAMLSCTAALAQLGPQGPMSRDAYLAAQKQRFVEMDANKDGTVTRDEMRERMADRMDEKPPARMVDALFARLDANGDGKASIAEAEAAAATRFARLDGNKDGSLSDDERQTGMERMRVRLRKGD